MITETGRVVAVEKDSLWVETVKRSTCSSCAAEPGCGQSLLARWGGNASYLRVLLQGRDAAGYRPGDQVRIGIAEDVVVKGSLLVYLLPLVALVLGSWLGQWAFGTEVAAIGGAVFGLGLGAVLVRWHAHHNRNNERLQPVLVDDQQPLKLAR
ncbi:SoxR reducing system RseC family protein [Exilibacterium tricleocarpae]|uniref:SoxR reducing system RseC family protein n=1 Tax=Exilibacterium tricleocarpae TaxID=2591008 RepID=A0A545U3K5_9GAMM|nr:SoxR reducing system RseC family protein [Exilibacterium tricleocarpae]TQV84048.1 SoxR reducing system RseC family protein [Exilibacterium tricleocarpae]